jgi:Putative peptidoglycan binding domain
MAEVPISGPVGAPPAKNVPADVRTVQTLLANVKPPLAVRVTISGGIDAVTIQAIREFQRRFMSFPDGRVDPDGRTIWHLNDGFVSKYIGLSADRRRTIDRDIINAQKWLSELSGQLNSPLSAGMKKKVKNIFHIDADDSSQASRLRDLVAR